MVESFGLGPAGEPLFRGSGTAVSEPAGQGQGQGQGRLLSTMPTIDYNAGDTVRFRRVDGVVTVLVAPATVLSGEEEQSG